MRVTFFLIFIILNFIEFTNSWAVNLNSRNLLIEKYKHNKELALYVTNIFNASNENDPNKIYDYLERLKTHSGPEDVSFLVDLLDYYLGETPNTIIDEIIVGKGKQALPYLKEKLSTSIVPGEFPNESNENMIKRNRTKRIITIMEHIYYKIPFAIDYDELTSEQITILKLYCIQKALSDYFSMNNKYPVNLSKLNNNIKSGCFEIGNYLDGWNRPIRYLTIDELFYFLSSCGKDGVCDSKDDLAPPIEPELHKFENRKQGT